MDPPLCRTKAAELVISRGDNGVAQAPIGLGGARAEFYSPLCEECAPESDPTNPSGQLGPNWRVLHAGWEPADVRDQELARRLNHRQGGDARVYRDHDVDPFR